MEKLKNNIISSRETEICNLLKKLHVNFFSKDFEEQLLSLSWFRLWVQNREKNQRIKIDENIVKNIIFE